jgi:phosphate transport system substrate-binding protein
VRVRRPGSVFLALWFVALLLSTSATAATRLSEAGSTLLYPLMSVWVAKYMAVRSGVEVSALPTGSSAGVAASNDGEVQLGASDAYLTTRSCELV